MGVGGTLATYDAVETLRSQIDIADLVREYIPNLRKSGTMSFTGLCPFHTEKTPSFHVNTKDQYYKCFGCDAKGDIITFIMNIESLDFRDALQTLAVRQGIELPHTQQHKANTELLQRAVRFYEHELERSSYAREALGKRGILPHTAREWQLGYAPGEWAELSNSFSKSVPQRELITAGLSRLSENFGSLYDFFRNRIMIPLPNERDDIVGFAGRALDPEERAKYLNSPESALYHKSRYLFGLGRARQDIKREGAAILTEGYFDVISAHQAGICTVVAPGGTSFTQEQASLLRKYCSRIDIMLDADSGGIEGAKRAAYLAWSLGFSTRLVLLPDGKDLDDLVRSSSDPKQEIMQLPRISLADFIVQTSGAIDDDEQKYELLKEVGRATQMETKLSHRMMLAYAVAQKLRVPENLVHQVMLEERKAHVPVRDHVPDAFIAHLLWRPYYAPAAALVIPPESHVFTEPRSRIYQCILDNHESILLENPGAQQQLFLDSKLDAIISSFGHPAEEFPPELLQMIQYGARLETQTLCYSSTGRPMSFDMAQSLLLERIYAKEERTLSEELVTAARLGHAGRAEALADRLEQCWTKLYARNGHGST